jgi:dolichyl-phosphate-mannose-protein mannosyltransferase
VTEGLNHFRQTTKWSFAPPQPNDTFSLFDIVILFMSIVFGFVSRTFLIAWPPYCVFDEIAFGNFTNSYIQRTHFIDVHPPFAKLLFAFVGYVCGYNGTIDFERSTRDRYKDRIYVNF